MMLRRSHILRLFLVSSFFMAPAPSTGQTGPVFEVSPIRGGLHLIAGGGGNIVAFPGPDGFLLVDAGMAEPVDELLQVLDELGESVGHPASVRYLINTHWHLDHTGGNPQMARRGATIVAHEQVLRAVSEDQVMVALGGREVSALPEEGRPGLTFNDRVNLSWCGDLLHVVHMASAHSDGDAIVHFRDADVVHLGDLFFNGMYPFIDVDRGGNLEGMVSALEEVLAHTRPTTLFVPGHGPVADRDGLSTYITVLRTVATRVRGMINEGMSRDEVIAAKPTQEFDDTWAGHGGFTEPDFWVGLVYDGLAGKS